MFLINRLNKQMPLQYDVTVTYGNQEVKIDVKHTDLNKKIQNIIHINIMVYLLTLLVLFQQEL